MGLAEHFDRFYFQDQPVFNQEINPESGIESMAVKFDWNRNLPGNLQSSFFKSPAKNRLINGLEQARAQLAVDGNRFIDNDCGYFVNIKQCRSPLRLYFLCALCAK